MRWHGGELRSHFSDMPAPKLSSTVRPGRPSSKRERPEIGAGSRRTGGIFASASDDERGEILSLDQRDPTRWRVPDAGGAGVTRRRGLRAVRGRLLTTVDRGAAFRVARRSVTRADPSSAEGAEAGDGQERCPRARSRWSRSTSPRRGIRSLPHAPRGSTASSTRALPRGSRLSCSRAAARSSAPAATWPRFASWHEWSSLERRSYLDTGPHELGRVLFESRFATVAAVNGAAFGAGLDVALLCDVRLASRSARFSPAYVNVGVIPGDGGAWLLPRIVGHGRAMDLLLSGRALDARDALTWGLVSEVCEPDALVDRATEGGGEARFTSGYGAAPDPEAGLRRCEPSPGANTSRPSRLRWRSSGTPRSTGRPSARYGRGSGSRHAGPGPAAPRGQGVSRRAGVRAPPRQLDAGFRPRCLPRARGARLARDDREPGHGRGGRSFVERFVVTEELLRAGAPVACHWIADRQIAPVLSRHGSEGLRKEFLPGILPRRGVLCVGLSEPDAGSDVAAIRTRAERSNGAWTITGTEGLDDWRSRGAVLLPRCPHVVGGRPHAGLSEFIVPMDAPGLTVRPIEDLSGSAHFNELFLDQVAVAGSISLAMRQRVPADHAAARLRTSGTRALPEHPRALRGDGRPDARPRPGASWGHDRRARGATAGATDHGRRARRGGRSR